MPERTHRVNVAEEIARKLQMNYVFGRPAKSPISGDNCGRFQSRCIQRPAAVALTTAGFQDAVALRGAPTTPPRRLIESGHRIDWAFFRGPIRAGSGQVHSRIKASDHYPLSFTLTRRTVNDSFLLAPVPRGSFQPILGREIATRCFRGVVGNRASFSIKRIAIANRALTEIPHMITPMMLSNGPRVRHIRGRMTSP